MQSNHGYPFPLVTRPRVPRDRSGAPRYLARRWREADDREQCVSDAAAVLNALETASARGSLVWVEPRRATSSAGVTASGDVVLTRLGRSLAAQYPRPSELSLCPDGALCELLRAKDLYSEVTASKPVAQTYEPERLRVTRGGLQPRDARCLVGPAAAGFLDSPDRIIAKSDDELCA